MGLQQQTSLERRELGGISFVAAGAGSARPLVMLHGIGSNAGSFAPLMECLARQRPLLAWDAPGYGRSAPMQQDWPQAADYARALRDLLDLLEYARIDLVGHSLGALIAGSFAAHFPERIERLYLISPALGYGTKPGEALAKPAGSRLDAMIGEGAQQFAATRASRLVHRPDEKPAITAAVTEAMAKVTLPGYAHASRMLSCADLIAEAQRIKIATRVIVGAEDQITPPANCRRLYDALAIASPNLAHRFELVADAGHAVCQEHPAEIARHIMDR